MRQTYRMNADLGQSTIRDPRSAIRNRTVDIQVDMGEIAIGASQDSLLSLGVGSCLVITMYDTKRKVGALAHAMLSSLNGRATSATRSLIASRSNRPLGVPADVGGHLSRGDDVAERATRSTESRRKGKKGPQIPNNPRSEIRDPKYVDAAIDEMLKGMEARGARKEDLEAKLIGGANLFSAFNSDIGAENVSTAEKKLKEKGINIVGESVGGSQGRSVEFCLTTGIVTVKMKF